MKHAIDLSLIPETVRQGVVDLIAANEAFRDRKSTRLNSSHW